MRASVAVAAGLVAAPALLGRGRASAAASTSPRPIPGGTDSQGLGGLFHLYGPTPDGSFDPIDAMPITIADFTGMFGLAYVSGMCTRTNMETNKSERFPFLNADMRFMKGAYIGEDGNTHDGAFAFIWIDVFDPSSGSPVQIHDLNPSDTHPTGLFWTEEMPANGIETELAIGAADMQAADMFVRDHGDIPNAFFGGGQFPLSGLTSFKVEWRGVDDRLEMRVDDPAKGQYAGQIVRNTAQMAWTATVGKYSFASDPIWTSSSSFAEMGQIRNGYFYLQEPGPESG